MRRCLERCPECFAKDDDKRLPVPGEGPRDARVLLCGEGPGKAENNIGRPFCGPTGQELDGLYLGLAGLSRRECYVTNSFKCKYADSSDTPDPRIVRSCAEFHLKKEIEAVNPEFIVLMGGIANSLVGRDIDMWHGFVKEGELFDWTGMIASQYHPALGLHRGSSMQSLIEDFKALRYWLDGTAKPIVDSIPNPSFYRLRTGEEVDAVMDGEYDNIAAIDTESRKVWNGFRPSIRYIPWSVQWCIHPGEAFMVRVEDKEAMERYAHHIVRFRRILMHNAPHDWDIHYKLNILLDWKKITDTMSMAYILADLPKGLKPLSFRLLGVTSPSFDDVTRPHGIKAAVEYLERAAAMTWPEPKQEPTGEIECKKCKECKGKGSIGVGRGRMRKEYKCEACDDGLTYGPKMTRRQGIGKKINRLLGDITKSPGTVDPVARWEAWEKGVVPLIDKLGPLPLPSVELVPDSQIDFYAMLDSHNTKRLLPILTDGFTKMRKYSYRV